MEGGYEQSEHNTQVALTLPLLSPNTVACNMEHT